MTSQLFITSSSSPRIMELKAEHDGIIETEERLRRRAREIEEEIDAIHLESRPELPTPRQREGILEALRRIRRREKASSHHGDPTCAEGPRRGDENVNVAYDVVVDGERGFISVKHLAPYSQRRRGGKLWHWTADELAVVDAILEHEGYHVVKRWKHDNGVSLIVALTEDPE